MTQRSRAFDDFANLAANAAGALKGVGDEVRAVGRARAEKLISELDLVTREEFDVMRARLDAQAAEISELKAQLAKSRPATKRAAKRKTASKPTRSTGKS